MKLLYKSLVLTVFMFSLVYSQNGTRLIDFNTKSAGRGGASIGMFDGTELMMTNPAGISFLNNSMLDVNFSLMFPSVHFKNNLNDADGDKNVFPLPSVGYVQKYNGRNLSWGIGFFTAGGMGADYKLNHALYIDQSGNYSLQKYHSKLAAMQGGITVAYKFNENFSAGASLHFVYSTLEFQMPFALNPSIMQGIAQTGVTFGQMFAAPASAGGFGYDEVTASAKMSELAGIGFNGKIGFAYKVNDKLSLGLSYTLPISLTYKNGKATMDMTYQLNDAFGKAIIGYMTAYPGTTQTEAQTAIATQFGQMGIDLTEGVVANYDLNADLTFPQSLGFGISYKVTNNFTLALDAEWMNWANAFDKMTLKLSNGTNSNINKMLGNSGSLNIDFPMNWKNAIILKVGGEYNVDEELTLKVGYVYGSNPVPESTIIPILCAIVDNHVMLGASYKVSNPVTIHAAFETAFNKSLTANNSSIIANDYDGSTSQLSTILIHFSLSYNF
jgi:long-chain fatty acid transport protein